jgi:acetylornithine aminotransferase/acetylornithine/N-succinyldiaminopimelate aminotransferase
MKMNKDKVKELDQRFLFQNYARQDICFDHGEREFLYDLDGKRYIDLVAGIAVNSLGYAHPAVTKAICEQAQRLMHVSNLYLIKEQAEAAEALASVAPPPLNATMFVNSGAEANEAALKLAVKATGRSRLVSTRNSFHGRTSMTLSATGQPKYQSGFEPLLSKAFDFIDYGSVEQLKGSITKDTAAFICEPIQGEGGIIPAGDEFFRTARDICDERGALFIVDEVQTGMGRTGRWFGFQHYRVVPDIVTLAKALGNGFPVGACLTSRDIAATFKPGMHGTTFGGNPLACAAIKAVINTMKDEHLVERSAELGASWAQELKVMAVQGGKITDVRGKGLMIGMEMGDLAKQFQDHALKNGILVNVSGGKVIRMVPPLIVSEASVRELNGTLKQFLDQ